MGEIVKFNSLDELLTLGDVLAKSGMFQDSRGAAQVVVKVLAGRELGFGAIAAMTGINVIKGRVTLSANLIAAAIKRSGKYNYRVRRMDGDACEIEFFEHGESIGVSTFTMKEARDAKLGGDNWTKYPRNMLFARAISNGAKWFTPDIFGGPVYTPDELGAEVDGETGEMVQDDDAIEATYTPAPAPQANGDGQARHCDECGTLIPANTPQKAIDDVIRQYGGLLCRECRDKEPLVQGGPSCADCGLEIRTTANCFDAPDGKPYHKECAGRLGLLEA